MKKAYMAPNCKWVETTSESILATTIFGVFNGSSEEIGWGGYGTGGGDINHFNVWGYDEEDEW